MERDELSPNPNTLLREGQGAERHLENPRQIDWNADEPGLEPVRRLGADGVTYPIGFITVTFNATNGHAVGGILIADNTGIPLEFVITSAVRPSRAQQILYGNRLRSYVAINLCSVQLLNAVKTRPSVVFVRDEWMLALHTFTAIPVLAIKRSEELGTAGSKPAVAAPRNHPEYADVLDLTSLDNDMLDAFDRIEKCREVLASKSEDYRL